MVNNYKIFRDCISNLIDKKIELISNELMDIPYLGKNNIRTSIFGGKVVVSG